MGRPSEAEASASAWRALAGSAGSGGWRTIPVTPGGTCRILAGRQLPGDEEAVLIGLRPARVPTAEQLPEGHGFSVRTVDLGLQSAGRLWFALQRQAVGSLELFTLMAADVIRSCKLVTGRFAYTCCQ